MRLLISADCRALFRHPLRCTPSRRRIALLIVDTWLWPSSFIQTFPFHSPFVTCVRPASLPHESHLSGVQIGHSPLYLASIAVRWSGIPRLTSFPVDLPVLFRPHLCSGPPLQIQGQSKSYSSTQSETKSGSNIQVKIIFCAQFLAALSITNSLSTRVSSWFFVAGVFCLFAIQWRFDCKGELKYFGTWCNRGFGHGNFRHMMHSRIWMQNISIHFVIGCLCSGRTASPP